MEAAEGEDDDAESGDDKMEGFGDANDFMDGLEMDDEERAQSVA